MSSLSVFIMSNINMLLICTIICVTNKPKDDVMGCVSCPFSGNI